MNTIVNMKFGSHLYGTATETSDTDFKGVYLPSLQDVFLTNVKKSVSNSTGDYHSKNTAEDIDSELYSLQYFLLTLGKNGETVFLDMVHAPDTWPSESSWVWEHIRANRFKFYTSNLRSYLGYCLKQAAKYGVKGSRLDTIQEVVNLLSSKPEDSRLGEWLNDLPSLDHIRIYEAEIKAPNPKIIPTADICGKKFQSSCPTKFVLESLNKYLKEYGHRAQLAKENAGIDWKAVGHAFRSGFQLLELYKTGDLVYPLKESEFLKKIKTAQFHYINDGISQKLEDIVTEVRELSEKSSFPKEVDMKYWEDFITHVYTQLLKEIKL